MNTTTPIGVTEPWALAVLGREESDIEIPSYLGRILITGASGSIGTLVQTQIEMIAEEVIATDIEQLDVRDPYAVNRYIRTLRPDVILHLAGAKHAPRGEMDPYGVMVTNTIGTFNVLEAASNFDLRVVVASTCKAVEPVTAYGASKLIAERMALNVEATVARYFNVIETSGNVFEIWSREQKKNYLPVARKCSRRFITAREAVGLTLWCCTAESGRYIVDHTCSRTMDSIARSLYPDGASIEIEPRRGDRLIEPEYAAHETKVAITDNVARIESPHDLDERMQL